MHTPPWELPAFAWDRRLLRNYHLYFVEGKGGLRVLLGETEAILQRYYGKPFYRDYFTPETLSYSLAEAQAEFILYRGRIIKIRMKFKKNTPKSLVFLTALGLKQEELPPQGMQKITQAILKQYRHPGHVWLPPVLHVYARGINFIFKKEKIFAIEIYYPRRKF